MSDKQTTVYQRTPINMCTGNTLRVSLIRDDYSHESEYPPTEFTLALGVESTFLEQTLLLHNFELQDLDQLIEKLQSLRKDIQACSPNCKGWDVFYVNNEYPQVIQKCDECDIYESDLEAAEASGLDFYITPACGGSDEKIVVGKPATKLLEENG